MTEKQRVEMILKADKIPAKVKITQNRIDVKRAEDMPRVAKLFPAMTIVYGFYK